jgi:hypothetical protein
MDFRPVAWPNRFHNAEPQKTGHKLLRNLAPANRCLKERPPASSGDALLLASLATHLGVSGFTFGNLFRRKLSALIKAHNLTSLLEIGPYAGRFIGALASLSENPGLKLHALGLASQPLPDSVRQAKGYIQNLAEHFGGQKFDLIVSAGVFSDQGFSRTQQERDAYLPRAQAAVNSFKTMMNALSDHPLAACIAVSFDYESLLPRKDELTPLGRISFWYGLPTFAKVVIITKHI